jgi:D-alanyl-D-alanine carboxypeptidase
MLTKKWRRTWRTYVGAVLMSGLALPALTSSPAVAATAGLQRSLDAVHAAGMPGVYAAVRDGGRTWKGASGVADTSTGRPVTPDSRHRIGSITKTLTATAVLQQVAQGRIALDAPIGRYLPDLVPGERGRQITVRMLLNHTSGINDYDDAVFASLGQGSTADLDRYRFHTFRPEELVRIGMNRPATNEPGAKWAYSNTNYVLAGLLLEKVTGRPAATYITEHVIRPAGMRHTYFPGTNPYIAGPHSKAYYPLYGLVDPPGEYSVYNMSWASTAGEVVSTMADLDAFYAALLGGRLVPAAELAEMERTVPMLDASGAHVGDYGLALFRLDLPCGRVWGHDGAVFGMETMALSSADGRRQLAYGLNESTYQHLKADGTLEESPIDDALRAFILGAMCPGGSSGTSAHPLHLPKL